MLDTDCLDAVPRLGWISAGSPITKLEALAHELDLRSLSVKRDDCLPALYGGSKPRKLDYLLAAGPYRSASGWHSVGALGSGHLVALARAAELLSKELHAHVFRAPLHPYALENLAFTAARAARIHDEKSRLWLLAKPALLGSGRFSGLPVVPPGATSPLGTVGMVRAGLELGADVRAGRLVEPDTLYVAFGSGGTAIGLAIGCALAGLRSTVAAVAIVERPFVMRHRVDRMVRSSIAELARFGVPIPRDFAPRLRVIRTAIGRGYERPTEAGTRASALFLGHGIASEPAYTGKTLAALVSDARARRGGDVLFWNTCRGALPAPEAAWESRLPPRIRALVSNAAAARAAPFPDPR